MKRNTRGRTSPRVFATALITVSLLFVVYVATYLALLKPPTVTGYFVLHLLSVNYILACAGVIVAANVAFHLSSCIIRSRTARAQPASVARAAELHPLGRRGEAPIQRGSHSTRLKLVNRILSGTLSLGLVCWGFFQSIPLGLLALVFYVGVCSLIWFGHAVGQFRPSSFYGPNLAPSRESNGYVVATVGWFLLVGIPVVLLFVLKDTLR